MITAIIDAGTDEKALARTLNGLIGATVEGLVREVVLLAGADNAAALRMADQSGSACMAPQAFGSAVATARCEWLMLLEAGLLFEPGWMEHVATHVQASSQPVRFARSALAPRPLLARLFKAERPLALGLLIPKAQAAALTARAPTMAALAASTRPQSLMASVRPAF
jgi:hypothetical protein